MFDNAARLRPAAFFDIAQDLAELGSMRMHFSDADLAVHGYVWILVRMSVKYEILPVRGDTVDAFTWHMGINGPFFIRKYLVESPDGNVAVRGTSSWIIMSRKDRHIVYPRRLEGIIPFEPETDENDAPFLSPKIVLPQSAEMKQVSVHRTSYSDLDYNGHVNNARYAVWALDILPEDVVLNGTIREFNVNYNREVLPGEDVQLFHAYHEGHHYVEGRISSGQSFLCDIVY